MINEYFASLEFEKLGLDTEAARKRADDLAFIIQREMKSVVEKKLEECVQRLNSMKHYLELHEDELDYISYYDTSSKKNAYNLKVSLDLIVATGYAHLVSNDEDEMDLEM